MALDDDEAQWRWFIDAWLPVDGIAFISLRVPCTDIWQEQGTGDAAQAAETALCLRAPLFQPEAIERRVAFGAVQRGAQEGFSLDGVGEFAFESVDQVMAFVRRVYVGAGPPGTVGGAAPPQPLPGGPDRQGGGDPWPELDIEPGANADAAWSLAYDESEDGAALGRKMAGACSATVRRSAANLLIRRVRAAFDDGDNEDRIGTVMPQLHAALLLTADARDFWHKRFAGTISNEQMRATDATHQADLAVLAALVNDFFYTPPWFAAQLGGGGVDWRHGRLPAAAAAPLQLPTHVDTWLAALCYVCADRRYLCRQPFSVWGPLLLALTAPGAISQGWRRPGDDWHDAWSPLVARSMRIAAVELLPVQSLPSALEDNIERWCRRAGPLSSPLSPRSGEQAQGPGLMS